MISMFFFQQLVGGWTNPIEKYERQIGSSSPSRDEHKKYMKPPHRQYGRLCGSFPAWKNTSSCGALITALKGDKTSGWQWLPVRWDSCFSQRLGIFTSQSSTFLGGFGNLNSSSNNWEFCLILTNFDFKSSSFISRISIIQNWGFLFF